MELNTKRKYAEIIKKNKKAPTVFKNGTIFISTTGEFIKADLAISDNLIVGIGSYDGENEIDVEGKILCPGFIDAHLHLESTLVTPKELIHEASKSGTTAFIVDPHESANVSGTLGIDYILEETEDIKANVYVMMPSCVPSTEIDDNACTLLAKDMETYVNNQRVLGLGEVMDCPSVINCNENMHKKLDLFSHKIIDGHAPFLSDEELSAYSFFGIKTDHECTIFDYALKEARLGMQVLIREGSAAKNLEAIVSGLVESKIDTSNFSFCTDDKHIEDIIKDGHISYNVKKSIKLGLEPTKAIQMATINTARCYGLNRQGVLAPGYEANIVVIDNLEDFNVLEVYYHGKKIEDEPVKINPCNKELLETVKFKDLTLEDLKLAIEDDESPAIELIPGQITTTEIFIESPYVIENGKKIFKANKELQKIVSVERHKNTGKYSVGIVKGFGIQNGAIASTVGHDAHNIISIGDNDKDIQLAINHLKDLQGGYVVVSNGEIVGDLPLQIMGLMSNLGYEEVNRRLKKMINKAYNMGVNRGFDPFITLSFLSLPVIPEIRITPRGLYSLKSCKIYEY